ncbi:hypothetical protein AB0B89_10400 [Sphaerisporangium sp. NPDC049002]|uniref:hypothetical protein n=1 Tax=unclassified Sphaerisporangium TaxID=2630420 RepID=UPI0033C12E53
MIERADQLVLEYVSKVADAAHGVLRTDQRLDFVGRLRTRIEEERRGSADLATVRKVIARFGDPGVLLQREIQRLAAGEQEAARRSRESPAPGSPSSPALRASRPAPGSASSASSPSSASSASSPAFRASRPAENGSAGGPPAVRPKAADDFGDSATEVFPAVADDATAVIPAQPPRPPRPARPAGPARPARPVPRGAVPAPRGGSFGPPPDAVRTPLAARLRGRVNATSSDGRDIGTILRNDRREVIGMALLILAGLLIPFPLPYVAIFPFPVLVWAAGALTVLASEGWIFKDRLTGLVAPVAAYLAGGLLLGALRSSEEPTVGLQAFVDSFWHVSGLMFMLGAVGGVMWLAYRLLNPPPPPPRRQPLGTVR